MNSFLVFFVRCTDRPSFHRVPFPVVYVLVVLFCLVSPQVLTRAGPALRVKVWIKDPLERVIWKKDTFNKWTYILPIIMDGVNRNNPQSLYYVLSRKSCLAPWSDWKSDTTVGSVGTQIPTTDETIQEEPRTRYDKFITRECGRTAYRLPLIYRLLIRKDWGTKTKSVTISCTFVTWVMHLPVVIYNEKK